MIIEIWSDFACPFCYIGKRKLEKALSKFEHKDKVQVIYKAFELNKEAPLIPEGKGYQAFAKLKHMDIHQAKTMMDQVSLLAKPYGLVYDMANILMVSTYQAHQLAKWARTKHKEKALTESLMQAYFKLGLNIASHDVLAKLVEDIGLDKKEALAILESDEFKDVVDLEIKEAHDLGIQGVPFFVFDRKFAISGAQPDENFDQALKKAYQAHTPFEILSGDDEPLCAKEGCTF